MSLIARFLSPDRMRLDLAAHSRRQVFEEAARLCAAAAGCESRAILDSLETRERLGSTGLGQGVAFPHARITGLQAPIAAYLRLRPPIPFEAPDGKPVSDLLTLLVPERATEFHLELLADAAAMFADRAFRDRLRAQPDARSAFQVFADWPGTAP